MPEYRLGDDVDDFCIKCKRMTNHAIVSLVAEEPAKVRCRSCYNDHDFRRGIAPPSKKELKAQQLMAELLAAGGLSEAVLEPEETEEETGAETKKTRKGKA